MTSLDLVPIYVGPGAIALMLQEMLEQHGIACILQATDPVKPYGALFPYDEKRVVVSSHDVEVHRDQIEECLALINEPEDK